jgi:hypothetical protein
MEEEARVSRREDLLQVLVRQNLATLADDGLKLLGHLSSSKPHHDPSPDLADRSPVTATRKQPTIQNMH